MEITAAEEELTSKAAALLREHRREGRNAVVAGVLARSGASHFGLELVARTASVCAEPGAVSAALLAGDEVSSVVAVCYLPDLSGIVVIGPCGSCRDLLHAQAPGCRVLVRTGADTVVAVPVEELLPQPDLFLATDVPAANGQT